MLLAVLGSSEAIFGVNWQEFLVPIDALTGSPDMSRIWTVDGFLAATKKVLPAALVLGSASMGNEMRIGRTAVLESINAKYVETAKMRGVPDRVIVWKHVFRNALIPLVPIITSEAFLLVGGSVLVELIFGINGLGYLFYRATVQGDIPLAASLMFVFIVVLVAVNITQDIVYTLIDPRVGYDGQ
jgi:peptide/nickel transport system permease protein